MTLHTLTIRPAGSSDLPALGRLGALLVRLHHDFDPERFIAATDETERAYGSWLGGRIGAPDAVILVAERDGEVVGYAYGGIEGTDYLTLRGPAGVLYDLMVDPDHRGEGVGRALLKAALSALEARGTPRAVLVTAHRNVSAQRLFVRAGFRPTMVEMTRETEVPPLGTSPASPGL
ncbi:MAG TPA: GNAT family N-acetyltransferase [Rhodothermales bacterium]|nr:GNAT family N-acetyltransferase [Rhodothermales bacterium]